MRRIFSSVGTKLASIWKPSRTATSLMKTRCTCGEKSMLKLRLKYAAFAQCSDSFLCVAQRRQDLVGMLAKRGAWRERCARRVAKLGHDPREIHRRAVVQR